MAVVFDNGLVTTYINGVEADSQTLIFSTLGDVEVLENKLHIGGRQGSSIDRFMAASTRCECGARR